jgi:hypothetical protein
MEPMSCQSFDMHIAQELSNADSSSWFFSQARGGRKSAGVDCRYKTLIDHPPVCSIESEPHDYCKHPSQAITSETQQGNQSGVPDIPPQAQA